MSLGVRQWCVHLSARPYRHTQGPAVWKCSRSLIGTLIRFSCFRKWRRDAALETIAWTWSAHMRSLQDTAWMSSRTTKHEVWSWVSGNLADQHLFDHAAVNVDVSLLWLLYTLIAVYLYVLPELATISDRVLSSTRVHHWRSLQAVN